MLLLTKVRQQRAEVPQQQAAGQGQAAGQPQAVLRQAGDPGAVAGAVADGTTVTITAGGTYVLTGQMPAGQVVVNADGEYMTVWWDPLSGRGVSRTGKQDV